MNLAVLVPFLSFVALISAISIFTFKVDNKGARMGRIAVSSLVGLTTAVAVHKLWEGPELDTGSKLFATLLFVYAIGMSGWTWATIRRHPLDFVISTNTPRVLYRHGPFAIVRHPFYSSYCAGWIGVLIASRSADVGFLVILLVLFYTAAIRQEENAFIKSDLRESYYSYVRDVPQIIPYGALRRRAKRLLRASARTHHSNSRPDRKR